MATTKKNKGYIIAITDSEGNRFFAIEGAEGIGKTTIERADSSALYWGYQSVYPRKKDALARLAYVRILAEAKGEHSSMADRPVLPVSVAVEPYRPNNHPYYPKHTTPHKGI